MKCKPSFFNLNELPKIDLSGDTIEDLAKRSSSIGLTVPGVQKKLSIHLSDDDSHRLTIVGHPASYILKPQSEEYKKLPEAEDVAMDIAEMMGVKVAPHGLIEVDGEWAYIAKRVDRVENEMYAMEDFCQLSGRLTSDKYKGSYERCAKIISEHSSMLGFDLSEFYLRLVVCFIIGNSDMHLKNFSLIEKTPGEREYVLSPAYDFLPVNIVLPEDKEETALTLNGKKTNIRRKDFLELSNSIGLNAKAAESIITRVIEKRERAIDLCERSFLDNDMKDSLIRLMEKRIKRLNG